MELSNNMNKILIIEDEPSLLAALVKKFSQVGFKVFQAKDGQEGLSVALSSKPDIILLDIDMPKMDGITMLKKLRAESWGKDVPVIVLTNINDINKAAETLIGGVHDYLIKTDWKLEDVVKIVKDRLASK